MKFIMKNMFTPALYIKYTKNILYNTRYCKFRKMKICLGHTIISLGIFLACYMNKAMKFIFKNIFTSCLIHQIY